MKLSEATCDAATPATPATPTPTPAATPAPTPTARPRSPRPPAPPSEASRPRGRASFKFRAPPRGHRPCHRAPLGRSRQGGAHTTLPCCANLVWYDRDDLSLPNLVCAAPPPHREEKKTGRCTELTASAHVDGAISTPTVRASGVTRSSLTARQPAKGGTQTAS